MTKPGAPPLSLSAAQMTVEAVNEAMEDGFELEARGGGKPSAKTEAAKRLRMTPQSLRHRLTVAEREYGLTPDSSRFVPRRTADPFTLDDLPDDGEPTAEELIKTLAARHAQRKAHHDAAKLRRVQVNIEGPIAIAMFGDPHVDDPGCAWGDLERDVATCRDTEGFLAVDVGDDSNNWVGRLQRLYAQQEVTSKSALKLIEWLMLSLPWLLRVKGNHDGWNTEKGDPADFIQRMGAIGVLEEHGARLHL
ncbi:MAG: hypothetical protein KGJ86_23160 [Chloroflexota bacterium]|nr:hypothetical protein [Chloroflexota bacterium]